MNKWWFSSYGMLCTWDHHMTWMIQESCICPRMEDTWSNDRWDLSFKNLGKQSLNWRISNVSLGLLVYPEISWSTMNMPFPMSTFEHSSTAKKKLSNTCQSPWCHPVKAPILPQNQKHLLCLYKYIYIYSMYILDIYKI